MTGRLSQVGHLWESGSKGSDGGVAERISGVAFDQLVAESVCGPAGMADTGFLRSDELPAGTALGYLPIPGRSRTNVFHLPVRGSGDGGIYSTATDISALWRSLFTGRIVPARWVAEMVRPRSDVPAESKRYGLGFWLGRHGETVMLEGYDAGVSFWSMHDPKSDLTCTVISNSSDGAWPITRRLEEFLDALAGIRKWLLKSTARSYSHRQIRTLTLVRPTATSVATLGSLSQA